MVDASASAMLTFELHQDDSQLPWRETPDGLARGKSRIVPLRHPALEEVVVAHGRQAVVCVRERCVRAPSATSPLVGREGFEALSRQMRSWPLQWHMIVVDNTAATVEAGHWGTAPVFFTATDGEFAGDWDAQKLLGRVGRDSIDLGRAGLWLVEYATPYATHTLFTDLTVLPERTVARWSGGSPTVRFTPPPPWSRPYAGRLRPEADPIATFADILDASLRRWACTSDPGFAHEVSGGLDSCLVTAIAHRNAVLPQRSYGLALLGTATAEDDQRNRRAEIVQRFGLHDTAIQMARHLPLSPGSGRLTGTSPTLPWEEGYYEAMDALLESARRHGTRSLATGFGGDELFGLRPSERRAIAGATRVQAADSPDEFVPTFLAPGVVDAMSDAASPLPRAASSESAVEAAAFSSARYLRRGIWPIHPLCTPELVHYCARLPVEWRRGRRLERDLLTREGLSQQVTHPHMRDDFSPAMSRSMRTDARPHLERLFKSPALADLGIVDGARLRSEYRTWCDGVSDAGATHFYAAAILELALQNTKTTT